MVGINTNVKELTGHQNSVLTGLLLGDGCLGIRKNCANPRLTIRRQILDLPYLEWQFDAFNNLCRPKAITTGTIYDKRYDKTYEYCNLESRYIPAFLDYYNKWYPNKKKIVPTDLVLDNLIIAVWVGDDGSIAVYGKNKNRLRLTFHTQGFSKDEVFFLKNLLDDRYNTKFIVEKQKKEEDVEYKYVIVGHDNATRSLLKDIDNVFPQSMKRKSDIWRNPDIHFYENEPKQFRPYNAEGIKQNVLDKIILMESFTIKSLCQDLNYFYVSDNGQFTVHPTVKRFIANQVSDGIINPINSTEKLSINTILQYSKAL